MHTEEMIREANEIFSQIESLMDRMKHMINEPPRYPACGEISRGICDACRNDPKN